MEKVCEECESFIQKFYCKECQQSICEACNTKIHNKSMRAMHMREPLQIKTTAAQIQKQMEQQIPSTSSNNSQDEINTNNEIQQRSSMILSVLSETSTDSSTKQKKKQLRLNPNVEEFKIQSSNQMMPMQIPKQQQPSYSDSQLYKHMQVPVQSQMQNRQVYQLQQQQKQQFQYMNQQLLAQQQSMQQTLNRKQEQKQIPLLQEFQRMDKQSIIVQTILMQYATSGELMVLWDQFLESLREELLKQQNDISIEEILQNTIDLYHQTMRKFGNIKPIFYISLKLNHISIQGITWILKSIQRDHMTPSEKLIFSRIKECFGYKINQLEWNGIIEYLLQMQKPDQSIDFNHIEIPALYLQKTKDCMNNSEFYLILFKDQEWVIHDQGPIKYEDRENWNNFVDFITDFFREDKHDLWITSVMNIHSYDPKKSIVKPPKSVTRAIPGGRYGCAQMLKQCGSNQLKSLSLGKLSMFVQEAITESLLIYYKTLLIKGNLDQDFKKTSDQQGDIKSQRIQWVKTLIIDILKEQKQGVSLARLPKLIQKRVNFSFDIQDLGFLKLKNLLKTIDGVWIENDGTTYAYAFFNETNFNINTFLSNIRDQIKIIIEQNITGITGEQLFFELTVKLGHGLDLKAFNSENFSEFLQKYVQDICEVKMINKDDKFHYMVYPCENNAFNKLLLVDQAKIQRINAPFQQSQQQSTQQHMFQQQQQQLNLYDDQGQLHSNAQINRQYSEQNDLKFIEDLLNEDEKDQYVDNEQGQNSVFHLELQVQGFQVKNQNII